VTLQGTYSADWQTTQRTSISANYFKKPIILIISAIITSSTTVYKSKVIWTISVSDN
jgi:CTP-dependent riboflavin kinase